MIDYIYAPVHTQMLIHLSYLLITYYLPVTRERGVKKICTAPAFVQLIPKCERNKKII